MNHRIPRGFTVVEVVIVVIVLGVLGSLVIPQFTNASTDAQKSSLATQLRMIQQQIAYYKLQHNDAVPPLISTKWAALTQYTDIHGGTSPIKDASHFYGPYLLAPPVNPLTANASRSIEIAADSHTGAGWAYDETGGTGNICATGTDSTRYFNPQDGTESPVRPW